MAATNTSLAAGEWGAYEIALTAATVDTVTFSQVVSVVDVTNHDATAYIYVRLDGTDPVSKAKGTIQVKPATTVKLNVRSADTTQNNSEVRLISAGTPTYSVARSAT